MPQVILTARAVRDLTRLRDFLRPKNAAAAKRAATVIIQAIQVLAHQPKIGRPVDDMEIAYRELIIDFGDSGYIALYRYENDSVTVLSFRHQKEAGYTQD